MTIDTSKEAVDRLLDGVTPGPWYSEKEDPNDGPEDVVTAGDYYVASLHYLRGMDEPAANASFIAAARELVPALAAERDAQTARADAAEAEVSRLKKALVHMTAERDTSLNTASIWEAELTALRAGQDALVAAAYEAAARWLIRAGMAGDALEDPLATCIRALTPSDATAALDAKLLAERNKARREVHDAIADYPRVAPDEAEWTRYDDQIAHSQQIILAMIETEGK